MIHIFHFEDLTLISHCDFLTFFFSSLPGRHSFLALPGHSHIPEYFGQFPTYVYPYGICPLFPFSPLPISLPFSPPLDVFFKEEIHLRAAWKGLRVLSSHFV